MVPNGKRQGSIGQSYRLGFSFILILILCSASMSLPPAGASQQAGAVPLSQGVADLAAKLAKGIPEGNTMTVAVTDFPDSMRNLTCGFGRFVAERLTTLLSQHPQCRIIERRRLDMVLIELKLSMSELVDPTKARKLGAMLGVQGLVVGSVSDLGGTVDIDARIIDIQTSMSLPGASASIIQDEMVKRLINDCSGAAKEIQMQGSAIPAQSDAQPGPGNAPVFQSASIRATVGQISVSSDNRRVGLSVIIENISRNPLYIAFKGNYPEAAEVTLSDDRATLWRLVEISGIKVLRLSQEIAQTRWKQAQSNFTMDLTGRSRGTKLVQVAPSSSKPTQGDFTVISPTERITVVMNFRLSQGDSTPATTFSFAAQGAYFTASGFQNFAIGLSGIKAAVIKTLKK